MWYQWLWSQVIRWSRAPLLRICCKWGISSYFSSHCSWSSMLSPQQLLHCLGDLLTGHMKDEIFFSNCLHPPGSHWGTGPLLCGFKHLASPDLWSDGVGLVSLMCLITCCKGKLGLQMWRLRVCRYFSNGELEKEWRGPYCFACSQCASENVCVSLHRSFQWVKSFNNLSA